ncbi:MAG: DUF2147 domain-containing protein [Gammaproteobacteria bacterium]|nr:DUF2147 domain-containing protein [Gammaproteobacteria bacterium]
MRLLTDSKPARPLTGPARLTLLLVLTAMSRVLSVDAADLSSPEGLWAPTDGDGRPLGLIRIFEWDGAFYGRIEPSSPTEHSSARCTHCTGARKDQPIVGLVIMRNLKLKDGEYVGGDILDPRTGWVYGCRFELTDGGRKLRMRGYLGVPLLGRSQTWVRVDEAATRRGPPAG